MVGGPTPAAAQACSFVQVSGRSWLSGAGVDVHSNGPNLGTGYSCAGLSTSNPAAQNGYGWQCVELAARLYAVKGWGRVYADGGPAAGGYRYGAKYIPEGSPNLDFHPNGSGYRPVPGDLIIESFSSGWGHVSVVDRTVGSTVYAVEQNATLTGRHSYTLTGSTLSGQYGDSTRGFMHAPANTARNSANPVVFSSGDFTGDAKSDILAVNAAGDLYLYRGDGLGGFTGVGTKIGGGWGIFTKELSTGDFTGDAKSDILGITAGGDLYLYRGNGLGGFTGGGTKIGGGWGIFGTVFSTGDFTGDAKTDILGITPGGDLYLYRGNGLGGFTGGGTKIGAGWGIFTKELSTGDFTGDAKTDILGIKSSGDLFLYRGNGLGGFTGGGTKIGAGWGIFL
jgi:CHAP domain/FG-GAP-like repeat